MNLKFFCVLTFAVLTSLFSCTFEKIETRQTLESETLDLIKSLGLLRDDKQIIKYYSNFTEEKAGNFFTTKRVAHYWLDDYDKGENDTSFAFYSEISKIDTVYEVPDTYAPYMRITRKDSSVFKVYVGGDKSEVKSFFEEAILTWRRNRD